MEEDNFIKLENSIDDILNEIRVNSLKLGVIPFDIDNLILYIRKLLDQIRPYKEFYVKFINLLASIKSISFSNSARLKSKKVIIDGDSILLSFNLLENARNSRVEKEKSQDGEVEYDLYGMKYSIEEINNYLLMGMPVPQEKINDEERLWLYLCKGLMKEMLNFEDNIPNDDIYPLELLHQDEILYGGWMLFEDALAQEMAEYLTYKIVDKPRPAIGVIGVNNSFVKTSVDSNYDSCGLYQLILLRFALTLDGVGKIDTCLESDISASLRNIVFSSDFVPKVLDDYRDSLLTLEQILYLSGLIYNNMFYIGMDRDFVSNLYEELISIFDSNITLGSDSTSHDSIKVRKRNKKSEYNLEKMLKDIWDK